MGDPTTVSELLASQSERKLAKMRNGVVEQIERLGLERPRSRDDSGAAVVAPAVKKNGAARGGGGQFGGLSREDLLEYVREMDAPAKAPEVRDFLVTKGVVRTAEAIRIALIRLHKAGKVGRNADGRYYVPANGTSQESTSADGHLEPELTLDS